jgi:opacity protein-like surface antigen
MKKCILMIGVTALSVWTAAGADVPKVGVYLGYDYVRFNSATNVPAFSANGGGGPFIYNFNGWVSGVADLGAVHNGNISGYHLDSTIANFLFGPRLSIRRSHIVTPYFQVLWGGVYAATSTQFIGTPVQSPALVGVTTPIPGQPITVRPVASQTAFAMTAGGGLDIKISRHVLFRPIGVDYYLTRMQNLRTAGDNNQNNIRYSAGFTFLIGGEKPTPPPPPPAPPRTKNCPDGSTVNFDAACPKLDITLGVSATSRELCQGDATQVVATAGAANQLQYAWSVKWTGDRQGADLRVRQRRPRTRHVQDPCDGQWRQFQPGGCGDYDHGSGVPATHRIGLGESRSNQWRRDVGPLGEFSGPMRRHHSGAHFRGVRRFGARKPVRLRGREVRPRHTRGAAQVRDDYRQSRRQS